MKVPKPVKNCKNCGKVIEVPIQSKLGLGKFCTPYCAVLFNMTQVAKEDAGTTEIPEIYISKGIKRFKKLLTTDNPLSKGVKYDKTVLDRDEDYLNFVRNVPCIICGAGNSHAHHMDTGGTGVKGSDYSAIPLCHIHHTGSNTSVHHFGGNVFESFHQINIKAIQNTLLINYLRICRNHQK